MKTQLSIVLLVLCILGLVSANYENFDPDQDFAYFDTDGDEKIVFDEFLGFAKRLPEIQKQYGKST